MPIEIVSVGSEYLLQQSQHNSVATIANRLIEIGVEVDYTSAVVGDEARLEEVLRQAIERATLVFVVSGVSTGEYDLTKKLLTRVLQKRLVLNYRLLDNLKEQFENRGETMPGSVEKRALVPTDTEVLSNDLGIFPGFLFTQDATHVVLFPGNPPEVDAMLRKHLLPRLDPETFRLGHSAGLILKTCGLSLNQVQEWLKGLERGNRKQTIYYLSDGEEISIVVNVRDDRTKEVESRLESLEAHIRKKLGTHIYAKGSYTLEEVVGALLNDQKQTLAVAESCTGGLIAHKLTNVPGSSAYFERGVVVYSNDAKIAMIDVSPNIIERHGAVSAETATAMAEGVRWIARTSIGLAVTGIAGPSGGTPEKPVGLVYIAIAADQAQTLCRKYHFTGERLTIKTKTAQTALNLLRQQLLARNEP